MATLLFANIPVLPKLPIQANNSVSTTYSPQTSISEYLTPQASIDSKQTSSDSTSTSTERSSTEDTDDEDCGNMFSTKNVRFNVPTLKTEISLKLENDEAEFFAVIPSEDSINTNDNNTTKPTRKRDKIHSMFHKTFQRSNSSISDPENIEWNEVFAKSLVSMHEDIQEIITGFDQIEQPVTDDSLSNTSPALLTEPRLSFRERQREKIEIMRMAQMLNPPNLLTYNLKESPYPYTDIIEPHNFHFLRVTKRIPDENLLIQHKPYRHKKSRYRTQRALLRMKRDLNKIKRHIYGKPAVKSQKELPSLTVQNYRNRLEKALVEVRKQIAEYDRIHSSTDNHRQSISQVIEKMKAIDPVVEAQIEDYRTKLRPIEYVDKKQKNELISAPFIPRRARYRPDTIKKDDNKDPVIDIRFDPDTFVDLTAEAEDFFSAHKPFWNQPSNSRLSLSSLPSRRQSDHFVLPSKTGVWDRFVHSFKTKQKNLRNTESKQIANEFTQADGNNDDEFFDCTAPSFQYRKSQSAISSTENNHVEF